MKMTNEIETFVFVNSNRLAELELKEKRYNILIALVNLHEKTIEKLQ